MDKTWDLWPISLAVRVWPEALCFEYLCPVSSSYANKNAGLALRVMTIGIDRSITDVTSLCFNALLSSHGFVMKTFRDEWWNALRITTAMFAFQQPDCRNNNAHCYCKHKECVLGELRLLRWSCTVTDSVIRLLCTRYRPAIHVRFGFIWCVGSGVEIC